MVNAGYKRKEPLTLPRPFDQGEAPAAPAVQTTSDGGAVYTGTEGMLAAFAGRVVSGGLP